jgi:hypothetical protein
MRVSYRTRKLDVGFFNPKLAEDLKLGIYNSEQLHLWGGFAVTGVAVSWLFALCGYLWGKAGVQGTNHIRAWGLDLDYFFFSIRQFFVLLLLFLCRFLQFCTEYIPNDQRPRHSGRLSD